MKNIMEIIEFENTLVQTKLACGKSIFELCEFDSIALWWGVDFGFFYTLSDLTGKKYPKNPVLIILRRAKKILNAIIRPFRQSSIDFFIKYYVLFLMNVYQSSIKTNIREHPFAEKKQSVFITGEDIEWRTIFDYTTEKYIKTDQFFHSVIGSMEKKNISVKSVYNIRHPFIHSTSLYVDKLKHWHIPSVISDIYFDYSIWEKKRRSCTHFKKMWDKIKDDPCLTLLIEEFFPEKPGEIKYVLDLYFNEIIPEYYKQILVAQKFIANQKPDLILIEEETGRFERALIVAARMNTVPTMAIQHGVIHENAKGHLFKKGEIADNLSIKYPFAPVPDLILVYGNFHRYVLTEISSFPERTIIVTGSPRYDRIPLLKEKFRRSDFNKDLRIDSDRKIILWATGCSGFSDQKNMEDFDVFFGTIKKYPDMLLIVKPHPGDSENHIKMMQSVINQYQVDVRLFSKDQDIISIIPVSDLVVVHDSTVGMEAVAFGKPLVQFNITGSPDQVDYVKRGMAAGVYKKEQLGPTLKELLENPEKNAREREAYISEYLYKVDGLATERVTGIIETMLSNRGNP